MTIRHGAPHLVDEPLSRAAGQEEGRHRGGPHLLVTVFYLLARHQAYDDLGPDYFAHRDHAAVERRSIRRLEALGYRVTLEPLTPATSAA